MTRLRWFVLAAGIAVSADASAQQQVDGFAGLEFRDPSGAVLPYRIFIPATRPARKYPLVIYLHGSGGSGTDNLLQISGGNKFGTHAWTAPAVQAREPVFVLAPQMPKGERWDAEDPVRPGRHAALVLELLAKLQKEYPIDAKRIYLTGQSLGGLGTWDIATKRPELFAAVVPLCGGGNPAIAARLRGVPVWAFHGALDESIPVTYSREMVAALRAAGGAVRYTEFPDMGHAIWQKVYGDSALIGWMLTQHRTS